MWDELFTLLGFCLAMAISLVVFFLPDLTKSFLAGMLPLSLSLSQSSSRVISALGSGLLVGACLIIIIPEGIEKTYSAGEHPNEKRAKDGYDYAGETYEPHGYIGLSLIMGFILMYLIDHLPKHMSKFSRRKRYVQVPLSDLSQGAARSPDEGISRSVGDGSPISAGTAATIGLVIHAIADGMALAASTFVGHTRTGLIVFFALMIHKAPAAFGLTSVLLKKGLTKSQARNHLICFSLASPLGAIATWLFVRLLFGSDLGERHTRFAIGMILIFSGGTFLYVAMHTAQDGDGHDGHDAGNGHAEAVGAEGPRFRETALAVTGMLLPLLAEIGHAH